jgi:hypothetical protein
MLKVDGSMYPSRISLFSIRLLTKAQGIRGRLIVHVVEICGEPLSISQPESWAVAPKAT